MSREWARLELGGGSAVWSGARARFLSQVTGPHFEAICRDYAIASDPAVFGGPPGEVGSGVVSDPANRTQIQIDVAVLAPAEHGRPRKILSLGEVKWDRVMDLGHVERLRRARDLLAVKGFDTQPRYSPATPAQASTANCKPANAPTSVLSAWISSTRMSVLPCSTRPSNCGVPIWPTPEWPWP